jgi:preprotein translocase subunit SecG
MSTVLLIIHLFVTLALIGVVLIQRSEGGGLGIGTSQGMGSFMSGRGTANLLSRTTAILATLFMALALVLALIDRGANSGARSILDIPVAAPTAPATTPSATEPAVPGAAAPGAAAPAAPAQPSSGSPSTAPGSLAAPAPAASPAPVAPAPGSTSSPAEPAVPGAAAPGSAAPVPPKGAPAVPTN